MGGLKESEDYYRQFGATDASSPLQALRAERLADAETFYRQAAEAGRIDAAYDLAALLEKNERQDDARVLYGQAAAPSLPVLLDTE